MLEWPGSPRVFLRLLRDGCILLPLHQTPRGDAAAMSSSGSVGLAGESHVLVCSSVFDGLH